MIGVVAQKQGNLAATENHEQVFSRDSFAQKKSSEDLSDNETDQAQAKSIPDFDSFMSPFLEVTLAQVKKRVMHHNRFLIEVKSDKFKALIVSRIFNDIAALYEAMRMRFKHIELPDMPNRLAFWDKINQESTFAQTLFQRIVDGIHQTQQDQEKKRKMGILLYRFLFKMEQKQLNQPDVANNQHTKNDYSMMSSDTYNSTQDFTNKQLNSSVISHRLLTSRTGKDMVSSPILNSQTESLSPMQEPPFRRVQSDGKKPERQAEEEIPIEDIIDQACDEPMFQSAISMQSSAGPSQFNRASIQQVFYSDEPVVGSVATRKLNLENFPNCNGTQLLVQSQQQAYQQQQNQNILQHENGGSKFSIINALSYYTGTQQSQFAAVLEPSRKDVHYSGKIYIRYNNQKQWSRAHGLLTTHFLQIFRDGQTAKFDSCHLLFKSQTVRLQEPPCLEFFHKCDAHRLQIACCDVSQYRTMTEQQLRQELNATENLVSIIERNKRELEDQARKAMAVELKSTGKVLFEVKDVNLPRDPKAQALYYVRVLHEGVSISTGRAQFLVANQLNTLASVAQNLEQLRWDQRLYLPLFSNYSVICVELVRRVTTGWFKENSRDTAIARSIILCSDLLTSLAHDQVFDLQLGLIPLPQTYDNKAMEKELLTRSVVLNLRVRSQNGLRALVAKRNDESIYEDYAIPKTYERVFLKRQTNRLKRIVAHGKQGVQNISELLNCKYERLSAAAYSCILLAVYFFEFQHLFNYIIILLAVSIIYLQPQKMKLIQNVFDWISQNFAAEQYLNPGYYKEEVRSIKSIEQLKHLEHKNVLVIQNDWLLNKVKKYKGYLMAAQHSMFQIASFLEKLKNLFTWMQPAKTSNFLLFLLILFIALNSLPWRVIIFGAVLKRWYKGHKYYRTTRQHNRDVVTEVLQHCIMQPNFTDFHICWVNRNQAFPTLNDLAKLSEKVNKSVEEMLGLKVEQGLVERFKTADALINHLSASHQRLYVSSIFKKTLKNKLAKFVFRKKNSIIKKAFYFLYNIPSDFYLLEHPIQIK